MQITFSPMRFDTSLTVDRQGDTLRINGEVFDFTPLTEGAILPRDAVACTWLASDVMRVGGAIHLTLILPHSADAPAETRFPEVLTVVENGLVAIPPYSAATPDEDTVT